MTQTSTLTRTPVRERRSHPDRRQAWLAVGLVTLGFGALVVAVLGPLVGGIIEYHASEGAVNQIVGGDVAGLILVGPISFLAGGLVWRRHLAGPVLALGPAAYALYMYSQLALGGDVIRYPGNSERFFPLFVGVFVLAAAILLSAWRSIDGDRLPDVRRWIDRSIAVFFMVVAMFLSVGLHLRGLIDAWADNPSSTEYLADPVVFWLVKFMDLGIVVPVLLITGIGVYRTSDLARTAKYAAVGWAALLGSSVAGMAVVMQLRGDPAGTTANTVAFSGFAVVAIWLAVLAYKPLFGGHQAHGFGTSQGSTQ